MKEELNLKTGERIIVKKERIQKIPGNTISIVEWRNKVTTFVVTAEGEYCFDIYCHRQENSFIRYVNGNKVGRVSLLQEGDQISVGVRELSGSNSDVTTEITLHLTLIE